MKILKLLKDFIYRHILVCYVNGLAIDQLEVNQ